MHDDEVIAAGSRPLGGAKAAGNATRYRGTGSNVGRTTVGRRLSDSGARPASRDNIRPPRAVPGGTVKKKKGSAAGVPKATGNAQKARTRAAGGGTTTAVTGVTNRTATAPPLANRVAKKKKITSPTTNASRVKKKKASNS